MMTKIAAALVVMLGMAGAAQADDASQVLVVPEDDAPFTIAEDELVKLTGRVIAGGSVAVQIDGPAKVVAAYRPVRVKEGQRLIGTADAVYLLQPTGKGEATVTLTSQSPIPNTPAAKKVYKFTVE